MLPQKHHDNNITRIWYQDRWYFSVFDVIRDLTGQPEIRLFWAKVKRRLKREGASVVLARCKIFTHIDVDVAYHGNEYADTQTLLRIIQSIPSPKAEPFKQWLAQLGADIIENDTVIDDRTEDRRRLDLRQPKAEMHKGLHAEIHQRGVRRAKDHAEFDVRGHKIYYNGETPRETEEKRDIPPGDGPKWMGSEEMADVIFRDAQSRAYITRMDIQGKEPIMEAHEDVSRAVRKFITEELGNTPPEQLPKAQKSIDQAAKDEERRRTKGMDLWPELPEPEE